MHVMCRSYLTYLPQNQIIGSFLECTKDGPVQSGSSLWGSATLVLELNSKIGVQFEFLSIVPGLGGLATKLSDRAIDFKAAGIELCQL